MPMIDVYLSESILTVEQRQVLADRLAGLARAAEGVGDSPLASRLSWVYLHPMPDFTVTRSGAAPRRPLWRIEIATPDGLLDAGAKARLSPQLVRAVLDAEADGAQQLRVAVAPQRSGDVGAHALDLDGSRLRANIGFNTRAAFF